MSDARSLLKRYCDDGDRSAFNTFYRRHADRLWRFLRARGCDEEAAYDLLSESFLRFIQVVCRDPRYPVALLYRIAINLRTDEYRRNRSSPIDYADEQADRYIPDTGAKDIHSHVRALIKTLPEREQNLLLLRYWIGLTHKEIAASLEIPAGTVRRQCAQALNELKRRWQGDENE